MGVTLTPTEMTLRFGPVHDAYGDEYAYSAQVQIWGDRAHIVGLSRDVQMRDLMRYRRELAGKLRALGVRHVEWERHKNGRIKFVRHDLGEA